MRSTAAGCAAMDGSGLKQEVKQQEKPEESIRLELLDLFHESFPNLVEILAARADYLNLEGLRQSSESVQVLEKIKRQQKDIITVIRSLQSKHKIPCIQITPLLTQLAAPHEEIKKDDTFTKKIKEIKQSLDGKRASRSQEPDEKMREELLNLLRTRVKELNKQQRKLALETDSETKQIRNRMRKVSNIMNIIKIFTEQRRISNSDVKLEMIRVQLTALILISFELGIQNEFETENGYAEFKQINTARELIQEKNINIYDNLIDLMHQLAESIFLKKSEPINTSVKKVSGFMSYVASIATCSDEEIKSEEGNAIDVNKATEERIKKIKIVTNSLATKNPNPSKIEMIRALFAALVFISFELDIMKDIQSEFGDKSYNHFKDTILNLGKLIYKENEGEKEKKSIHYLVIELLIKLTDITLKLKPAAKKREAAIKRSINNLLGVMTFGENINLVIQFVYRAIKNSPGVKDFEIDKLIGSLQLSKRLTINDLINTLEIKDPKLLEDIANGLGKKGLNVTNYISDLNAGDFINAINVNDFIDAFSVKGIIQKRINVMANVDNEDKKTSLKKQVIHALILATGKAISIKSNTLSQRKFAFFDKFFQAEVAEEIKLYQTLKSELGGMPSIFKMPSVTRVSNNVSSNVTPTSDTRSVTPASLIISRENSNSNMHDSKTTSGSDTSSGTPTVLPRILHKRYSSSRLTQIVDDGFLDMMIVVSTPPTSVETKPEVVSVSSMLSEQTTKEAEKKASFSGYKSPEVTSPKTSLSVASKTTSLSTSRNSLLSNASGDLGSSIMSLSKSAATKPSDDSDDTMPQPVMNVYGSRSTLLSGRANRALLEPIKKEECNYEENNRSFIS